MQHKAGIGADEGCATIVDRDTRDPVTVTHTNSDFTGHPVNRNIWCIRTDQLEQIVNFSL